MLRLESRPPNIEGRGEVKIRDLVRNSLRMRPDRIVVGEIRDAAALDMLQAMNTGHDGSICTVHANAPRDVLSRVETMVLMAGVDLPVRAIREQVSSAIDLIVQQARFKDGTRHITHVTEVVGMEGDVITLQDLFLFDYSAGFDETGRSLGTLKSTGLRPKFLDKLAAVGRHGRPDDLRLREVRAMTSGRRLAAVLLHRAVGVLVPAALGPGGGGRDGSHRPGRATADQLPGRSSRPTACPPASSIDPDSVTVTVERHRDRRSEAKPARTRRRRSRRTAVLAIDNSRSMAGRASSTAAKAAADHVPRRAAGRRPGRPRHLRRRHRHRRSTPTDGPRRRAVGDRRL